MTDSSNPEIRRAISEGRRVKLEVIGSLEYTREKDRFKMEQQLIEQIPKEMRANYMRAIAKDSDTISEANTMQEM